MGLVLILGMLEIYYKSDKDTVPKILDDFKIGSWIHVQSPTDYEIERLVNEFGLDKGLVYDALDPFEVPRLETDKGIVYGYTRVPLKENELITTFPFVIIVGSNYLLTISSKEFPFISKFIEGKKEYATTQNAKLLIQLVGEINKIYQGFMQDMSRKVRSMSVKLECIDNKDIIKFVRFEEILNDFLSALTATNIVLNNLLNGKAIDFHEEDRDLIEDMFLSNGQLIESVKVNSKNIKNIREAYSTIMTQDLNRIIKILTVLTILLNVPVLVASLYGMNVALPGEESGLAFWWVIGSTFVVSAMLLFIFIRKKWL